VNGTKNGGLLAFVLSGSAIPSGATVRYLIRSQGKEIMTFREKSHELLVRGYFGFASWGIDGQKFLNRFKGVRPLREECQRSLKNVPILLGEN